jgi:hypothetical protein
MYKNDRSQVARYNWVCLHVQKMGKSFLLLPLLIIGVFFIALSYTLLHKNIGECLI